MDVAGQGPQRRDVDDHGLMGERTGLVGAVELVDADQEGGEGLARPGGRGDERVLPRPDRRPARGLWLGRPVGKPLLEPRAHCRMKPSQHLFPNRQNRHVRHHPRGV